MILDGKIVLITGGTGSFGHKFVDESLKTDVKKIIVFSRDELKQSEMRLEYPDQRLQFFLGDVRDRNRLYRAFNGVDIIIHAAALKQVPKGEYDPLEFVNTNILGAANVIDAAIDRNVQKVIALSSDKCVNPINLYGATKLCSDKLFVSGNSYVGNRPTRFSVVRYGNVVGSRGSVIPLFQKLKDTGVLPITDRRMTRFWITLEHGVKLVILALENMKGGEIFVPKIPSMRIIDLASAIGNGCRQEIIGIRPGEKLHEVMITEDDARNTRDMGSYYIIQPEFHWWRADANGRGEPVKDTFRYSSDTNRWWMTIDELKESLCRI